jgi:hypothetical protein
MQATQPGASHAMPLDDATLANRAVGAMMFFVFGAVWLEGWARQSGAGWPHYVAIAAAIAVAGLALAAMAWRRFRRHAAARARHGATPERRRIDRLFHIVNAVTWTVIVIAGNVLANTGRGAWVIPMAIFVLGLHFLPLARIFRNPPHYLTGAALLVLAVLYPLLASGGPSDPVGFLGAGLVLWLSALWALRGRA